MKPSIKPIFLMLAIFSSNAVAQEILKSSVEADRLSDTRIIRLKPEYKDPVIIDEPTKEIKSYEETSREDKFRDLNSFCAGYFASQSLGEMGTIDSLANLVFKNTYSNDQKLAVRLFTQHSNAYKRQGGISQEFYDLGGRLGGQIFMSGSASEEDHTFTKKDIESDCSYLRKGILPP